MSVVDQRKHIIASTYNLGYLTFSTGVSYDKTAFPRENWQMKVHKLKSQHPVIDGHANRISQRRY